VRAGGGFSRGDYPRNPSYLPGDDPRDPDVRAGGLIVLITAAIHQPARPDMSCGFP